MILTKPLDPTPDRVRQYGTRFDVENKEVEDTLSKLFATFPDNRTLAAIRVKVMAVDALYSTNIYATYIVAKHIHSLGIDTKLHDGSEDLVCEIADCSVKGKKNRFYSFATKYCGWHFPNAYPNYDRFAEKLLARYAGRSGDHSTGATSKSRRQSLPRRDGRTQTASPSR